MTTMLIVGIFNLSVISRLLLEKSTIKSGTEDRIIASSDEWST